jgi:hypothetical protein
MKRIGLVLCVSTFNKQQKMPNKRQKTRPDPKNDLAFFGEDLEYF